MPFAVVNVIFVHSESEDVVFAFVSGFFIQFFVQQNHVNLQQKSAI